MAASGKILPDAKDLMWIFGQTDKMEFIKG
jgi:hypothetical protein